MLTVVKEERNVIKLYFLTDILIFWLSMSLAILTRLDTLHEIDYLLLERDRWICIAIFATTAWLIGCYRSENILDRFDAVYYLILTLIITAIAEFALTALLPVEKRFISRTELVVGAAIATLLLTLWHFAAATYVARLKALHRFFYIVGDEQQAKAVAQEINDSPTSHANATYITRDKLVQKMKNRTPENDPPEALEDAIVTLGNEGRTDITSYLEVCEKHCRHTYLYPTIDDALLFQHQNLISIAGLPLIMVGSQYPQTPYMLFKRLADIVVATTSLLLTAPLLLITALAVLLTSRGGIFYKQERLGRDGKPFTIFKFRSMVKPKKTEDTQTRAEPDDQRITRVGSFIRKYKIDELPQLINILRGDMTLVGPRPLWKTFFEENGESSPLWERRLIVRPGLTSLLHVQGHSFAKASDFLRYDLIYINNISLLNDLRILLRTFRIVLSGKGEAT
jgi:exopolysaccharide biosynthesis polyprenyl glycosylphosphotransferase